MEFKLHTFHTLKHRSYTARVTLNVPTVSMSSTGKEKSNQIALCGVSHANVMQGAKGKTHLF